MTTRAQTTSLQRTYRYLRIAVTGTVVVIFVAVAVTIPVVGVLPSLSHYYYTPARTLFVAALITVGVCLFALSGRGPERILLDVAAILVLLVAIVPTVISPGSIDDVPARCIGACVPAAYEPDVDVGVVTYLIVGVILLIVAAALTAVGEVEREGGILSLAIASGVLLVVGLTWWLWCPAFLQWTHFIAAIGFFGVIAAVAVVNAFWPARRRKPTPMLKAADAAIAVARQSTSSRFRSSAACASARSTGCSSARCSRCCCSWRSGCCSRSSSGARSTRMPSPAFPDPVRVDRAVVCTTDLAHPCELPYDAAQRLSTDADVRHRISADVVSRSRPQRRHSSCCSLPVRTGRIRNRRSGVRAKSTRSRSADVISGLPGIPSSHTRCRST